MKKKKLTLEDIQVNSFITSLNELHKETIHGAAEMAGSWWISDCLLTLLCPRKVRPVPPPDTRNPINPACTQGHPSKADREACEILSLPWPPVKVPGNE